MNALNMEPMQQALSGLVESVMVGIASRTSSGANLLSLFRRHPPPAPVPAETQLKDALHAFAYVWNLDPDWADTFHAYFLEAGINSMHDLVVGCREETINVDLEFAGVPETLETEIIAKLQSFLPGPVGFRCFRLAHAVADRVERGQADAKYVHRPEDDEKKGRGPEQWKLGRIDEVWKVHVDCAGFVRSVLKHVSKDPFILSLSDRNFMRAKDFYRFFETLEYSILDHRARNITTTNDKRMHWRVVRDLRAVIPGDVIVYRPKGNAAGGAAFTENDRSDLKHVLKAVKTAQIWKQESSRNGALVTRNVARDPQVKTFVDAVKTILADQFQIRTVKDLRAKWDTLRQHVAESSSQTTTSNNHPENNNDESSSSSSSSASLSYWVDTELLNLMKECSMTSALNTGHIVFASGPAVYQGGNEYRIKVVHSTKFGKTDEKTGEPTEGVQEHYRRFQLIHGNKWTRQKIQATTVANTTTAQSESLQLPPMNPSSATTNDKGEAGNGVDSDDDEDADVESGDPEDEDESTNTPEPQPPSSEEEEDAPSSTRGRGKDELAGLDEVEVLAARMCF
jgi:hypothetical protein